jgi:DNA repair exonuclease SbcCD ATPase subunit
MTSKELNEIILTIRSEISDARNQLELNSKKLAALQAMGKNIEEAITVLTAVLSVTQDGVVAFIREVVSSALKYVYNDEYDFLVEYDLKRNQSEVILLPMKNGRAEEPKYSCGVGVVDVCSFALRVALWALEEPRSEAVLVFDEPFRHVHGKEENEKLASMVSHLSGMLGLQIIIVSGESALQYSADRVFLVTQTNGVSNVEVQ